MKSSTRQCDRRERSWRPRFTTAGQCRKTNTVEEPQAMKNMGKEGKAGGGHFPPGGTGRGDMVTRGEPKALDDIWKKKQSGAEGREGPVAEGAKGKS